MGKVNEWLAERRLTEAYLFGWQSAERGEPEPPLHVTNPYDQENQVLGWKEYHEAQS